MKINKSHKKSEKILDEIGGIRTKSLKAELLQTQDAKRTIKQMLWLCTMTLMSHI